RPSALPHPVRPYRPPPACYIPRPSQPSHPLAPFPPHTTRLPSPHSGPTPHTNPGIRRCPGRLGRLVSCVLVLSVVCRYQNINWLSIDYACRPRLRSRLTQGGLA